MLKGFEDAFELVKDWFDDCDKNIPSEENPYKDI